MTRIGISVVVIDFETGKESQYWDVLDAMDDDGKARAAVGEFLTEFVGKKPFKYKTSEWINRPRDDAPETHR